MKPVLIIEMGVSPRDVSSMHLELVKDADILVGEKRHLEYFRDVSSMHREITRDFKGTIDFIKARMETNAIVVLASADPMVFGIGPLLIKTLGRENVFIYPNSSSMMPVTVIGMGLSPDDLTPYHLKVIREADILVGRKRHLAMFGEIPAQKKEISDNLPEMVEYIKSWIRRKSITVLTSGDPLFHGIGPLLIESLGPQNVTILPNVSAVAAAFSRIKESWQDVHIVSLRGRYHDRGLVSALGKEDKIAVFTGPENPPSWVAGVLIERKISDFNMCVLEQLGSPQEHADWYTPEQVKDKTFPEPNLVVLRRLSPPPRRMKHIYPGMPDAWFDHEDGAVGRPEIRSILISKLRLNISNLVLWDLGGGNGHLGIEASHFLPKGTVHIVEKNAGAVDLIEKNKKRFRINNLEVVRAAPADAMARLPKPDRIYIDGGGKDLRKIIRKASPLLNLDGIFVIMSKVIQNMEAALNLFKKQGFRTDIIQVQVSRGRDSAWGHQLAAGDPVWIISGEKRVEDMA